MNEMQLAKAAFEVQAPQAFAPTMNTAGQAAMFNELVLKNDLSKLTEDQRVEYYRLMCERSGLDPVTKPFELITLNGKLQLYATKQTTAALTKIHGLQVTIVSRETLGSLHVVTARATMPNGSCSEDIGAVNVTQLQGEALANAMMKAITKAKRRAVLSVCGLGLLDESETDTLPAGTYQYDTVPPAATAPELEESDRDVIAAWADTIAQAEGPEDMTALAKQLKDSPQLVKNLVGPIMLSRASELRLTWKNGGYHAAA